MVLFMGVRWVDGVKTVVQNVKARVYMHINKSLRIDRQDSLPIVKS